MLDRPTRQYGVRLSAPADFASWRRAARALRNAGIPPREVTWSEPAGNGGELFDDFLTPPVVAADEAFSVPREFIERAQAVICHRDSARFDLLYRLLWRLKDEPRLMENAADEDVMRSARLEKAVRRDCHKMHAFVRFRRVECEDVERYAAWFEPDHHILDRVAQFFVRRFAGMRWSIFTPEGSIRWDGSVLSHGPAATRHEVPAEDASEDLWGTYFASIFNPARLKTKAMQAEMPKKYWRNLPEARLIPQLIEGAERSARRMIDSPPAAPSARHQLVHEKIWADMAAKTKAPASVKGIARLRGEAEACTRCDLYKNATQTVFGEGPEGARVMLVGEQPGDQEDIAGKPFVGPAGQILDAILDEAKIDRSGIYVTNAVKHFKFEPRGKRRIHAKPNAGEVQACRWWLAHELEAVKPELAVALGATAAQSLLGRPVAVTKERGRVLSREDGVKVFITIHPSFLLRIPDPEQKVLERQRFLDDMRKVAKLTAA
jgi:probable DNA metabolism protein